MHTRAVLLSASHMQCLWHIGKVTRPVLPPKQKSNKIGHLTWSTQEMCGWVPFYVCVCVSTRLCVWVCERETVFVCAHVAPAGSACKARDRCLIIASLWFGPLTQVSAAGTDLVSWAQCQGMGTSRTKPPMTHIKPKVALRLCDFDVSFDIDCHDCDWCLLRYCAASFEMCR